jgi:hypothetical protein
MALQEICRSIGQQSEVTTPSWLPASRAVHELSQRLGDSPDPAVLKPTTRSNPCE